MLKKVVSVLQQAVFKVHPEGPPRVLHLPNIFVIHYSSATVSKIQLQGSSRMLHLLDILIAL